MSGNRLSHYGRQFIQDNIRFAIDAFNWAAYMDRFGNLEVTYANLGQTRPIVAGLHPKLAVYEQQGVSWDSEKHGAVSQVLQEMVFKNEPEFLAGEEWERRQLSHRVTTRNGRSQTALSAVRGFQSGNGKNKGDKENYVLVEKRHMSLLNMESTAWKALRALRKVSLGIPDAGVFNLDFVVKPYDSFGDRLRDFRNLFRSSKAAVTNTTETPVTIRYAGRPGSELTDGSERKAGQLSLASAVQRHGIVVPGQVGVAGQAAHGGAQTDADQVTPAQSNVQQTDAQQDSSGSGSEPASEPEQDVHPSDDDDGEDASLTATEEFYTEDTDEYAPTDAKRRRISDDEEDEDSL
ncbi:hypothetical protein QBC32DRAFT_326035 [Pseudoneurospora amorphoporcata]|uniref:Uncharacterized protein n=1 Tax=Pseudoneurospora amorphoporcata TaxID=241081 RepID=A0AAN6SEU7_9PEZI|nr:hypothetical protein QBC32DRAFT_326035 [Pseudoneurospora amorphoporcata]